MPTRTSSLRHLIFPWQQLLGVSQESLGNQIALASLRMRKLIPSTEEDRNDMQVALQGCLLGQSERPASLDAGAVARKTEMQEPGACPPGFSYKGL